MPKLRTTKPNFKGNGDLGLRSPNSIEVLRSETLKLEGIVLDFHRPRPTLETEETLKVCEELGF